MQIVIDISDEKYNDIQAMDWKNPIWAGEVTTAIHKGTVLPEHHGELIERDKVIKSLIDYVNGKKTLGQCVDNVPTILETTEVNHER